MTKTGVFGGSFNPIHNGHIALARHLCLTAQLDEVWLMVSPQNPLKQQAGLLDDRLRLILARTALHGESRIKASDYEFRLPKPSYTWNTLQALERDYPDRTFTLLIGGDNWERFPQWYRADDILKRYPIVVYPRRDKNEPLGAEKILPEFFYAEPRNFCAEPREKNGADGANVTLVEAPLLDVSSTGIRQRVRQGLDIGHLVPPPIAPLVRKFYSIQ